MEAAVSKTYLVTGGAGFIGSHLAELLIARGDRVIAIDNLSTGRIENIDHLIGNGSFQFVRADVRDDIVMDRLASKADTIVHLAAAVGVQLIVEQPVHTIETNIMGTEAVLRSGMRYACRILIASTSEVYGKGARIPFSEDDDVLLGPTNKSRWAYAASKMVDEFLALAYAEQYNIEVVPFRLFNTVGPRQTGRYGMVVPRLMQQAIRNEPLTVFGDGNQQRCFCDVRDVVVAIGALAQHPDSPGRVYNIGATEEISILELAHKIRAMTGSSSEIVHVPYSEAYAPGFEDMQRRVPDTSRVRELIGWTPERTLDDILHGIMEYTLGELKVNEPHYSR